MKSAAFAVAHLDTNWLTTGNLEVSRHRVSVSSLLPLGLFAKPSFPNPLCGVPRLLARRTLPMSLAKAIGYLRLIGLGVTP